MVNAVPAIIVLVLTCLFACSTALPSGPNQIASPQAGPNGPRTLLGKAYRRCPDSQGCPPSCWIRYLADHKDSDAQALSSTGSCTQTETKTDPRTQMPLPLVLNTVPEFGTARLRLMKSKTPSEHSSCSDDASVFNQARSGRTTAEDEDAQRAQSLFIPKGPTGKMESRKVSSLVGRSKRLYGRGEWKSRLLEDY